MNRADIWAAILTERLRQAAKWSSPHPWGEGDCSSSQVADEVKAMVLAEECGEVSRAVLDSRWTESDNLRAELVQVAAVAVAWLESLEVTE